jgi:tRNA pseudouridine55 synthase
MARQRKGRAVDGILLLNKPKGGSSNHALQRVKRLYGAQKAGHTGSLDPMATGVLPICLGEATKFSQYLLNADKSYRATIKLGQLTATGDAEGEIIAVTDASFITREQFVREMDTFKGDIEQIPPMYSALKVDGQPLYKLAREGKEIERESRHVTIFSFELLGFRAGECPEADVYVECSKGTYIRSLAVDIARNLGVGGHLTQLHRVKVGKFEEKDSITFEELEALNSSEGFPGLEGLLLSAEDAVNHFPLVEVTDSTGYYVRLGQAVLVPKAPKEGFVRIREESGTFLGIGEVLDDGRITPRRLIANP